MPKVSPEYRDRRRGEILAAAARCFAANGFHATSMQNIFDAGDLTPGSFYRYFDSKADLIAALAEETLARLEELIDSAVERGSKPMQLQTLIRVIGEFERETGRGQVAVQLWSEAARDERVRAIVLRVVERLVTRLGAATEDEYQARVIFALLQGLTLQLAWDSDLNLEEFAAAAGRIATGAPRRRR